LRDKKGPCMTYVMSDMSLPTYRDIYKKNDKWKGVSAIAGIPSKFK